MFFFLLYRHRLPTHSNRCDIEGIRKYFFTSDMKEFHPFFLFILDSNFDFLHDFACLFYDLSALGWLLVCCLYKEVYLHIFKCVSF